MSADLEYRKRVAYHEAGHTIQYLLACARDMQLPQIHKVSILPDTEREGVCSRRAFYPLPLFNMTAEHSALSIKRAREEIKILLAGHAIEFLRYEAGKRNASDFLNAYMSFDDDDDNGNFSEDLLQTVIWCDSIACKISEDCVGSFGLCHDLFEEAIRDLQDWQPEIDAVSDMLLTHETIDEKMLRPILRKFRRLETKLMKTKNLILHLAEASEDSK